MNKLGDKFQRQHIYLLIINILTFGPMWASGWASFMESVMKTDPN